MAPLANLRASLGVKISAGLILVPKALTPALLAKKSNFRPALAKSLAGPALALFLPRTALALSSQIAPAAAGTAGLERLMAPMTSP